MRSSRVRLLFALALVLAGCRKSVDVEALMADNPQTRTQAVETLAQLSDGQKTKYVGPLITYLKNDDSRISSRAGKALAAVGAPAIQPLIKELREGEVFLKLNVLETLAQMGPQAEPAVQEIIAATSHSHPLVRAEAVAALGQMAPAQEAVPIAQTLLNDKDPGVREAAEHALGRLGAASPHSELQKQPYKSA